MSDKEKLKSMELQIIDLKREVESLKKTHKHDCLKEGSLEWNKEENHMRCLVCLREFKEI